MHVSQDQKTTQPVYSNQFLVDDIWYVTVVCPVHGLTDEAVPWAQAKTPHHAGVIADTRHTTCFAKGDDEIIARVRKEEIAAAKREVERADRLWGEAQKEARLAAEQPKDGKFYEHNLARALANLERHRRGPTEARKRLAATEETNTDRRQAGT